LRTFANTNAISNILGVSGGCEPEFALSYTRKTESLNGGEPQYFKVFCNAAKEYMRINNTDVLPPWFVSSADIHWKDRIDTQAVMQKYVDTAISSTVNLPKETTVDDIEQLYLYAWKKGLKGVTIFRDGCKRLGILTTETPSEHESEAHPLPRGFIMPKSDDLVGKLRTLTTGCGSLHVTAFFDPFTGDFVHTFLSKGSSGGCQNFMVGLSRMISLAARGGVSLEDIVDQLNSCGSCSSYAVRSATKHDTSKGSCCPMAIGNALVDMHNEMMMEIGADEPEEKPEPKPVATKPVQKTKRATNPCPSCGEELVFEGGCNSCKSCGWSKCS
jgi:ribonucleoside-diphosphate reductase alpha chain